MFLLDVDFVPSRGLHQTLKGWKPTDNYAYVVPAFEVFSAEHWDVVIRTKKELLETWKSGITGPF